MTIEKVGVVTFAGQACWAWESGPPGANRDESGAQVAAERAQCQIAGWLHDNKITAITNIQAQPSFRLEYSDGKHVRTTYVHSVTITYEEEVYEPDPPRLERRS